MRSEMRPLGEFITLVSGNTPSKANSEYWGGSTPWVSAKDMGDFWIEDAEDHLTAAGVAVASRLVPPGTVMLLTRGMTLHKRVPICRIAKPSTFNQDVKAVLPKHGLAPRFLPYLLVGNHDRLHERVDSAGHGTGRLNTDALLSFPVHVPPESEQEVIADLGEALDGRLRLLRQTNATLESIAHALFKSWFIDFDPVRAKAEGNEPEGMDAATAALFPAEFEESALGLIPKRWRVGTVRDVCSIFDSRRVPISGKERAERQGPYPYYGAAALMDHVDDFIFDGVYLLLGEDGSVTNPDGTPITQYVWGKFWVNNHAHVLQGTNGVCTEHLMLALRGMDFTPYVTGAVQAKLNQANLFRVPFLQADPQLSEVFGAEIAPLYEKLRANFEQAKTLEALRDTLLPRLISGQLRLPEAQAQVEEALA